MFRGSNFDKLLEKATSNLLMEPDWNTIMQINDLIRQNDVTPRNALSALKKKLTSTNPHTAMFAVELLESMVKNCGSALHDELTTPAYCETLHDLVKTTQHDNVRQKMLELIQTWTHAFRKNTKYNSLRDTMNLLKSEGFKFSVQRESDAMFSADSAPVWADGEVCHRCRAQFTLVNRKHHCRACGQVFCNQCSSKTSTLPKFGIEKEVRVCDACFDQVNKPSATVTSAKDPEYEEYLKSSLAQQNQAPPRKTETEIREEEELQLAIALSQSEAEAKEKEKMRATSDYFNYKPESSATTAVPAAAATVAKADRSPSPDHPELAHYLNRQYWENRPHQSRDSLDQLTTSPSAPATAPAIAAHDAKVKENGFVDVELEEFIRTLKSQVEIFINRMKSNSSRGRSIANDSSVQTLFMNITAMHSKLLKYIQEHDDSRLHYERLQDKLAQIKDARAALDALREEHREKLRRQAEEAERQRHMLMAHKLEIMRKKKQEYLQYQRQLALQRIQEQEREMHMRKEQQKQQYMMAPQYYMGSPAHANQYMAGGNPQQQPPPVPQPQPQQFAGYNQQQPPPPPHAYPMPIGMQPRMPPMQNASTQMTQQMQQQQQQPPPEHAMMPASPNKPPNVMMSPSQLQQQQQPPPPPPPSSQQQMMPNPQMMQVYAAPQQQQQQPQPHLHHHPQQQVGIQPGAPPASPQIKDESSTAELITFD